jgi:hypothetical protein
LSRCEWTLLGDRERATKEDPMMNKPRPWTQHFWRALTAPGNLIAAAGATMVAAITWNPLPLVLYGLGEPLWLYSATSGRRYTRLLLEERKHAAIARGQLALEWREQQLVALLNGTPCGRWTKRGHLPDYMTTYGRLVEMRAQTARIVAGRDDAARALEEDIVTRMDDMLRAYLMMVKERLLFHCSLAKVYPQLPEAPPAGPGTAWDKLKAALITPPQDDPAPPPWAYDTGFVSVEAAIGEVRDRLQGFRREVQRNRDHEEVYAPMIEVTERRMEELAQRGRHDLGLAAQLKVFPDSFEIILNKLATTKADVSEVVGDMKLLLEQTDDTVQFAADTRGVERETLQRMNELGRN